MMAPAGMDSACLGVLGAMQDSIRGALGAPPATTGAQEPGRGAVGVAFSGGVDSTLLAVVCDMMGYRPVLLTVGFEASHDMVFARQVASLLGMRHAASAIRDMSDFARMHGSVLDMVGTADSLSWVENSVAFYVVSGLARDLGMRTVVTANGIDELFCGYDAYRRAISEAGPECHEGVVYDLMKQKLENEKRMFAAINVMGRKCHGVDILSPLLSDGFCDVARAVPISDKITGPDDMHRKHVIRRLAMHVGVPHTSYEKRKKALQYGTGIHKALIKLQKGAAHAADAAAPSTGAAAPTPAAGA